MTMEKFMWIVVILCLKAVAAKNNGWESDPNTVGSNVTSDPRSGKFFSLFSIVKFKNDGCTGSNSYNGTCLTSAECSTAGGTAAGSCASGFGVCCTLIISKCGQSTSRNCTYFTNPGGVGTTYSTGGQCSMTVKKCDANICQLRLDFISFSIAQPTTTSNNLCLTDIFTVSGASNNVPAICGDNAGQHMYLDTTPGQDSWTLNFMLSGSSSRTWNLKLTQIPCDSRLTAPSDCLQYFTEASGTIQSYNFAFAPNTDPARQISNQDYSICIRKNQGFCGICYTACTDSVNSANPVSFTISESIATRNFARNEQAAAIAAVAAVAAVPAVPAVPADPATGAAAIPAVPAVAAVAAVPAILGGCAKDWVSIPCGTDQTNSALLSVVGDTTIQCVDKYCGRFFNANDGTAASAAVYSYRTPFEIRYYTDSTETDVVDAANMGFCLNYVQQACTSTG